MAKSKKNDKKKSKSTATAAPPQQKILMGEPAAPAAYVSTNVAPVYQNTAVAPTAYTPGTYASPYEAQLNDALNKVTNWSYDPMQDASYQALAKVYGARGNIAAKNSLADAAALNGGYGTSYAVSAAQQARNQYNQELASYIPQLEQSAYERASGTLSALRDADDTRYGRFRDTESDRQWKYAQEYQKYRDLTSDNQWKYTQDYSAYRDKESDAQWNWTNEYNRWRDQMGDYQYAVNYNYQLDRDAAADKLNNTKAKKSSSGGGGGGGRSRSSGAGGSSSKTVTSSAPDMSGLWDNKKKKLGNGGR